MNFGLLKQAPALITDYTIFFIIIRYVVCPKSSDFDSFSHSWVTLEWRLIRDTHYLVRLRCTVKCCHWELRGSRITSWDSSARQCIQHSLSTNSWSKIRSPRTTKLLIPQIWPFVTVSCFQKFRRCFGKGIWETWKTSNEKQRGC